MAIVIAMWIKTKDKKKKNLMLPAWISGIFGVTEPAIYGFTLPNLKLFIAGCASAAVGGAYLGFKQTYFYTMAGLGIFSIPGAISADAPSNVVNYIIGNAISIVLALVLGLILYKEEKVENVEGSDDKLGLAKKETGMKEVLSKAIKGQVLPLKEINDKAFADGLLGKGVAIVPTYDIIESPMDGTITTVFPTKHAIGITSDQGAEILIHVGLNTVELDGQGFDCLVKEGDKVKSGDKLMKVDFKLLEEMGYDITTPIIDTNTDDYLDIIPIYDSEDKILEILY